MKPWILWPFFPALVGLISLVGIRTKLFKNNLHDTNFEYSHVECDEFSKANRTIDGSCNNLDNTSMGMVGINFGRNVPLAKAVAAEDLLLVPNPRKVSLDLMTRKTFIPAESVNFLTAAWVQFLSHDLFFHGESDYLNPITVPLDASDPFKQDAMYIPSTHFQYAVEPSHLKTFKNHVTHWWDGSALYGSSIERLSEIRSFEGGHLKISDHQILAYDLNGGARTGFNKNWWVGLDLIHTLFTREHNAIADSLAVAYPEWNDEQLFHKARLINAALMAKVHVFGWSTAMIDTPAVKAAMGVNWNGLLGAKIKDANVKLPSAVLSGILGNKTDLAGVPYTITEEFVSVYRMHSLIRDSLPIRDLKSKETLAEVAIEQTRNEQAESLINQFGHSNLFYSFGTSHPGAVILNNHPKFMQNLSIPMVQSFDLAAVDVIRDRERGVPRYNEFRKLIHLKPIKSFDDFGLDSATTNQLKEIYQDNVDLIDLQIGALAEPKRPGFAFGETFFQIFVGMASRRLMADRFFTVDYRKEVYTELGIDWVADNSLKSILLRHYPELTQQLEGIDNAFKPWNF